jgi:hypothetical protein
MNEPPTTPSVEAELPAHRMSETDGFFGAEARLAGFFAFFLARPITAAELTA